MGVFQSGINNILMQAGIGARLVSDKVKDIKADKEAQIDQKNADEQAQKDYEAKMNEAIDLAKGYTKERINAKKTAESLGIDYPNKNPRGVSNKTMERRNANEIGFREIESKWFQREDWKERRKSILEMKTEDIANALKPTIRSRKKNRW